MNKLFEEDFEVRPDNEQQKRGFEIDTHCVSVRTAEASTHAEDAKHIQGKHLHHLCQKQHGLFLA